jgi:hypothetical protein
VTVRFVLLLGFLIGDLNVLGLITYKWKKKSSLIEHREMIVELSGLVRVHEEFEDNVRHFLHRVDRNSARIENRSSITGYHIFYLNLQSVFV